MMNFAFLLMQKYIEEKLGSDEKLSWAQHHIKKGFAGSICFSSPYGSLISLYPFLPQMFQLWELRVVVTRDENVAEIFFNNALTLNRSPLCF